MSKFYIFTIDTEQLTCYFERQMCAYVTGKCDDYSNASMESELYFEETGDDEDCGRFEYVISQQSDKGCYEFCSIQPTPGWYNDGHGKHFRDSIPSNKTKFPAYQSVGIFMTHPPSVEDFEVLKTRSNSFCEYYKNKYKNQKENSITITGFRLLSEKTVTTTEKEWKNA